MTEKVCQLYEEEQYGKVRKEEKQYPAAKCQTQHQKKSKKTQKPTSHRQHPPSEHWLQLVTVWELLNSYIQEAPKTTREMAQTAKSVVRRINNAKVIKNVKKTYGEAEQRIMITMRVMNHTSHDNHHKQPQHNVHRLRKWPNKDTETIEDKNSKWHLNYSKWSLQHQMESKPGPRPSTYKMWKYVRVVGSFYFRDWKQRISTPERLGEHYVRYINTAIFFVLTECQG